MPALDEYKSSWADEIELESGSLPPPTEDIDANGVKTVTEYKINKDDKKVKVVRTYKLQKHVVSKSVAHRRSLHKFGDSANDEPGPNSQTTLMSEDINMQLITNKEEERSNDAVLDPKSKKFALYFFYFDYLQYFFIRRSICQVSFL